MRDIQIKQFEVIETVVEGEILKKIPGKNYPVLIISFNSDEFPWNYIQWDLENIIIDASGILITFKINNDIIKVIIESEYFDMELIEMIKNYNDILIGITDLNHKTTFFSRDV